MEHNAVSGLAHDILKLRGQDDNPTIEQLISAYKKAEILTARALQLAERVNQRRDAA